MTFATIGDETNFYGVKAGIFAALGLKSVNSGLYDGVWADTAERNTFPHQRGETG